MCDHGRNGRPSHPRGWLGVAFCVLVLFLVPAWAAKQPPPPRTGPQWALEGGRKLTYEGSFGWERDVQGNRGFWKKVLDVAIGAPENRQMVRPYSIARDSRGRLIVTDPGAAGIHIFDFARKKYQFISRWDKSKDPMLTPQCVAVDAQDNIYVTDSVAGKIFVFDSNGKFRHALGSLRGGEGYFKRPTGIAVDSAAQRVYVTDTLRNKVFILDMQGNVLDSVGKLGEGNGEFNLPTEALLHGPDLAVVDAMNFRIQIFDRSGTYKSTLGSVGDTLGKLFRPKGIGFDSDGHLYVVDASADAVQVFTREGDLLFYFGQAGTAEGEFQLPSGIAIDQDDRVYVVDSYNRRVQIFHYHGVAKQSAGGTQ
jgi:DNA-binding beta-propeller fold protein YncE